MPETQILILVSTTDRQENALDYDDYSEKKQQQQQPVTNNESKPQTHQD